MSATRRQFLSDCGQAMFAAGLGASFASDLGLSTVSAEESTRLTFGALEPLSQLIQETPGDKLLPILTDRLAKGLTTKQLASAAALANARTFGGENYFGMHVFMAFAPAYHIGRDLPTREQALPLLKVLYRNAHYAQQTGGAKHDVLTPHIKTDAGPGEQLRAAVNKADVAGAEAVLNGRRNADDALEVALLGVEDNHDVHSIVLPWRAYEMLDVVGKEHATTLLRQAVRQCAIRNVDGKRRPTEELARARKVLPTLLDKHRLPLPQADIAGRAVDDAWVDRLSHTILASNAEQAGEAVAMALAEGVRPSDIGEAISLAANQLVLRQLDQVDNPHIGKRCHGDSPGVHSSDATNAWRNIVRVGRPRTQAAGLILAAMDVARMHVPARVSKQPMHAADAHPYATELEAVASVKNESIFKELDGAVRENAQFRACALVARYAQAKLPAGPVFDLMRTFAVSEDGRLHGEKYFHTVTEEFRTTRPAFQWRQLMALARVTASMYGMSQSDKREGRAPGYELAKKLLG